MNEKTKDYLYSLLFKDLNLSHNKRFPEACKKIMEIAYYNELSEVQLSELNKIYKSYFKIEYKESD